MISFFSLQKCEKKEARPAPFTKGASRGGRIQDFNFFEAPL
jgi:hypothetical protein